MPEGSAQYAMTSSERTIHLVTVPDEHMGDYLGLTAYCGRHVTRLVHPSDHRDGGSVCRACDRADAGEG